MSHEAGNPRKGIKGAQEQEYRAGPGKYQAVAQITDLFNLGEPFKFPFLVPRVVEAFHTITRFFHRFL